MTDSEDDAKYLKEEEKAKKLKRSFLANFDEEKKLALRLKIWF